MGFQDYVSDVEAASLVGVSVATLSRFVEAGYLATESDSDGLRMFSKGELCKVFSIDLPGDVPAAEQHNAKVNDESLIPEFLRQPTAPIQSNEGQKDLRSQIEVIADNRAAESGPTKTASSEPTRSAIQMYENEVVRLRTLCQLQEKLIEVREESIKELKQERDWLRQRVETYEQKQDRDQLLILSETQTIRRLVCAQENKKSSLQFALEWFGFTAPRADSSEAIREGRVASTVEVRSQPNSGSKKQAA